jgi:hypothetical protein
MVILVVRRRAGVDAYLKGLIDGHQKRIGAGDFPAGDFLVVHLHDAGAALAEAGATRMSLFIIDQGNENMKSDGVTIR